MGNKASTQQQEGEEGKRKAEQVAAESVPIAADAADDSAKEPPVSNVGVQPRKRPKVQGGVDDGNGTIDSGSEEEVVDMKEFWKEQCIDDTLEIGKLFRADSLALHLAQTLQEKCGSQTTMEVINRYMEPQTKLRKQLLQLEGSWNFGSRYDKEEESPTMTFQMDEETLRSSKCIVSKLRGEDVTLYLDTRELQSTEAICFFSGPLTEYNGKTPCKDFQYKVGLLLTFRPETDTIGEFELYYGVDTEKFDSDDLSDEERQALEGIEKQWNGGGCTRIVLPDDTDSDDDSSRSDDDGSKNWLG